MTTAAPVPIEYQLIGLTEGGGVGDLLSGLDQKQGRIRLQALISEWLRMENLVVLTGSGTSVSAGGKTMANLEKDVLATIEALPDLPPSIAPIIESRKNAVAFADILGVQSVLRHGCPSSPTPWSSPNLQAHRFLLSLGQKRRPQIPPIWVGSFAACGSPSSQNVRYHCQTPRPRLRQRGSHPNWRFSQNSLPATAISGAPIFSP
jgi:hypothetical protein